ncbi:DUF4430 domain-containing protein [Lysinibacillus sphaericus]|uniref:DUF4430 domain-containing protein n=1 Tax=Lysinibacillus sphaericus TaxID=1421 RepID=UPI0038045A3D
MATFKKWWHIAFAFLLAVSLLSPTASATTVLQPTNQEAPTATFDVQLAVDGLYGPILPATTEIVSTGTTVLSLMENTLTANGIPYIVTIHPIYGPYLESVDGRASGSLNGWDGWVYTVNGISPTVGLDAYKLEPDDKVHIYYTTWAKLGTASTVGVGQINPKVTVDLTGDLFLTNASNIANWTINTGTTALTAQSITVNTDQQAVITFSGQAEEGSISITASANALLGGSTSEPLTIDVTPNN